MFPNQEAKAPTPEEKYALYYPYIHIRDSEWLKSTLLWFGQVRRIVPEQYTLNDPPDVRNFAHTPHPEGIGALLETARVWEPEIYKAKKKLLEDLRPHISSLIQKYAEMNTPEGLRNVFEIHRNKLLDTEQGMALPDFLIKNGLAWEARPRPDGYNWLAMHPKFGAAIMSTLALAIAKNEGLGIVTSDSDIHRTLIAERENDILKVMLDLPGGTDTAPGEDYADDLAQLIFTTQFDLSALTAQDIRTLIEEKKDLRHFRTRLTEIASEIPAGIGVTERVKRLENKKKEILAEWDEYRSVLPKFAKDALVETSTEEIVKKAAERLPTILGMAGEVAAGGITAAALGGAPGFALSIVAVSGMKMLRNKDSSMRFLSRVEDAVEKNWKVRSASLILPQWSKYAVA